MVHRFIGDLIVGWTCKHRKGPWLTISYRNDGKSLPRIIRNCPAVTQQPLLQTSLPWHLTVHSFSSLRNRYYRKWYLVNGSFILVSQGLLGYYSFLAGRYRKVLWNPALKGNWQFLQKMLSMSCQTFPFSLARQLTIERSFTALRKRSLKQFLW